MPRALIAAIHHWHSPFQLSSHFAARWLVSRGWDVAYVSAPLTPLHWLRPASADRRSRARAWRAGGGRALEGRLFHYVPLAPIASDNRPLLDGRWIAENWHRLCIPTLSSVLTRAGFASVDLLYLDNFYHAFWPRRIAHRRLVYHVADDYSGFAGYSPAFAHIERGLMARADTLVFPSAELRQTLAGTDDPRAILVPNGVSIADFRCARNSPAARPVVVYVGALSPWFDDVLLAELARRCPDFDFEIYGPGSERLPPMPANIRLCGSLERARLPQVLATASVGIVPFEVVRYRQLIDPVRPLKLLEYLAAGLPVVSTRWRAIEAMQAPIGLASGPEEFVRLLREAVATPPDAELLHRYAAAFDWQELFDREAEAILGDCAP